jgi:uncharacterized membrane protein
MRRELVLCSLVLGCALPGCGADPAAPDDVRTVWQASMDRTANLAFTTIDVPGATSTAASGINPDGDIVGRYTDPAGKDHGFLLRHGDFTSIDFPGADLFTKAAGINPRGDIVGNYALASEPNTVRHGYLLSEGRFTSIDFPGAIFTNALGISPQGDIVGRYMKAGGAFHGYRLSDGSFTTIDFPGAIRTEAWRSNAAGQIVGNYESADGHFHVFLLSDGSFTSIDVPGAVETAPSNLVPLGGITPSGDIVSSYCSRTPCTLSSGNLHGFALSRGAFAPLDVPGATLTLALGINPRGDIVGVFDDASHRDHGWLLANR